MANKLNLEEEIRCDFRVTTQRKKVWQKELDIVALIIDICNKNNIKYSAGAGTLLGAVRHHGFIPWDDDIDIMMKRSEYKKFIKAAKEIIKPPFFLQYYETEKGYYYGHAQIRDSNTTAIINGDNKNRFNHGIFVDIFPLDNIPNDIKVRNRFLNRLERKKRILKSYYNIKYSSNLIKKIGKIIYWRIHNIEKEIIKFEKLVQKYNKYDTEFTSAISFKPKSNIYKNKWFNESIDLNFEYLKIKCLKNYDEALKYEYGNYMNIPENKSESAHGGAFFDTDKSYTEYLNNLDEIIRKINNGEVSL